MSSHPWNDFSPFAMHTHRLLGILSMGLQGRGSYTVTASKNGLVLKSGRLTVAKGKDGRELFERLDALLAQANEPPRRPCKR